MLKHILVLFVICACSPFAKAQSTETQDLRQELAALRAELTAVAKRYDEQISKLEERLSTLEGSEAKSIVLPTPGELSASDTAPQTDTVFQGGERTLQALNPEISVTGDFTGRLSDNGSDPDFNRFSMDGFEMAIQHPLDPFSQAKFFVTYEDGEFDLEEGYMSWESLPGNLGIKLGRFHNSFGKLNRYHKHGLPWADRDLPTREFFGEEGLIGTGVSVNWLPPRLPWAQTNEISFEVVNNDNDKVFSGRGFGDPVLVGRLLNYYDLTDSAYFEWGVSAATSHWDEEKQNRSNVYGVDLSYRWQPPQQALYKSFELRSELFYNDRKEWDGRDPFGMYVSGEYQLGRRWFGGLRYQWSETIEQDFENAWSLSPFLTFWQSEWVRIRAQYDFLRADQNDDNRFFLQFTWSLGPHKHEAY